MQFRAFAAVVACMPYGHTVPVSTVNVQGTQMTGAGERQEIEHVCVGFCTPWSAAALDAYEAPAIPHNSTKDKKNGTNFGAEFFWGNDFSLAFLQITSQQPPFPKLVSCLPTCRGDMLLCRANATRSSQNASKYAPCLSQVAEKIQVASEDQKRLNALRQKEQSVVAGLVCSNICHEAKVKDGCRKACSVEMAECLDRLTNEQCEAMLGPDYKDYAGPPKVRKVEGKALRPRKHHHSNKTSSEHKVTKVHAAAWL